MTATPDDDIGTVRWFGEAWPSPARPAPVCDPRTRVPVPLGERCADPECEQALTAGDSGIGVPCLRETGWVYLWWHAWCWLRHLGLVFDALAMDNVDLEALLEE